MRIGISALHRTSGGSLTHLVQLLEEWERDGTLAQHYWIIFASPDSATVLRKRLPGVMAKLEIVVFPGASRGLMGRLIEEQVRLPRALRSHCIEVLLCPANIMPFRARVPVVVSFQNAAPFCDTVTRASVGTGRWLQFKLLGWLMRLSARRARMVIFISWHFRDLFVRRFGFDPQRGHVIPRAGGEPGAIAPDPLVEARLGVRRPFVLSVSHLNPYKNTVELIEAFALSMRNRPDVQLVLVGMANFPRYFERIRTTISRLGVGDRVVLTGEIPHAQALSLMAACDAFVFTSTCENCPTALIEALSAGAAVGSSHTGVMPEVTGNAALLFDPNVPEEIASVLGRLMTDVPLREELRQLARARSRTFITPAAVAKMTIAVLVAARETGQP